MKKILKIVLSFMFGCMKPFYKKELTLGRAIKNILVFQPGGIGDILRIFPAIESLYANFPLASISIIAFPYIKEVFELFPKKEVISEIIDYEPEGVHESIFKRLSLIFALRRKKYDLIYVPERGKGTDGTVLVSFLIGAPHRIGYTEDKVGFLNTVSVEFRKDIPIVKQNLLLLKAAGIRVVSEEIRLSIPEKEMTFAKGLIGEKDASSLLISLHPGAVSNAKYRSWPVENYIRLIEMLIKNLNAKIVLIGSTGETKMGERILQGVKGDAIINVVGKTTIPQMAAVIKSSHLFIGNDSGPLHIAESVGTPFVGIFGPTSPTQVLSYPPGTHSIIVRSNLPCSPCYIHQTVFAPPCGGVAECLHKISVEEVVGAVQQLFATLRKGDLVLCE